MDNESADESHVSAEALEQAISDAVRQTRTELSDEISHRFLETSKSLRDELETRIDKQFGRDRDFLKETVGAALRVLGIAVAFVTAVLALFGVKTLGDIKDSISTTAQKVFEERLKSPTSSEYRSLERVLDRTLINSYSLQLVRQKALPDRDVSAVASLNEDDSLRLLRLVKAPDLDDALFRDAINVLVNASGEGQWPKIWLVLSDAISARGADFEWMRSRPDRRAYVLHRVAEKQEQSFAGLHDLLADRTLDRALRLAAVEYVRKGNLTNEVGAIENAAAEVDDEIVRAAIQTLACLNPKSPALDSWLTRKIKALPDDGLTSASELLSVARHLKSQAITTRHFFDKDPVGERRHSLAKLIWRSVALQGHAVLTKGRMGFSDEDQEPLVALRDRKEKGIGYYVSAESVFGGCQEVLIDLLKESARKPDLADFKELLYTLGVAQGIDTAVTLGIRLQRGATVALDGGTDLTAENAPAGAGLQLLGEPPADVLLRWTDIAGGQRVGRVATFSNVDAIDFSLTYVGRRAAFFRDE